MVMMVMVVMVVMVVMMVMMVMVMSMRTGALRRNDGILGMVELKDGNRDIGRPLDFAQPQFAVLLISHISNRDL